MPSSDPWSVLARHSSTCICRRCRATRRRAEWEYWRESVPVDRVPASQASARIRQLVRQGWKQVEIAEATGISTGTISWAKNHPEVLIDRETHEALCGQLVRPRRR